MSYSAWADVGAGKGRIMDTRAVPLTYSNENQGLTANLTDGTQNIFQFAMPIPGSIDKFRETIVIKKCDFMFLDDPGTLDGSPQILSVHASMLARDFAATYQGILVDAQDETQKAQYDGPYPFGELNPGTPRTSNTANGSETMVSGTNVRWTGPRDIDLSIPAYFTYVNSTKAVTAVTGARADADFTATEKVVVRPWVTFRKLSRMEKAARKALDLARIHT